MLLGKLYAMIIYGIDLFEHEDAVYAADVAYGRTVSQYN